MPSLERQSTVILITGPSGAGRSTAINVLEDMGYETIDNMPLALLPRLLQGPVSARPIAFGIDVRNRDFSVAAVLSLLEAINGMEDHAGSLVYIDCETETLLRR